VGNSGSSGGGGAGKHVLLLTHAATQNLTSFVAADWKPDTVVLDTDSGWAPATGIYTAATAGVWQVSARGATGGTGDVLNLFLYTNISGAGFTIVCRSTGFLGDGPQFGTHSFSLFTFIVHLAVGDQFKVQAEASDNTTIGGNATQNYMQAILLAVP
jgi:hypothetical protein